jgi:hypothetical protein
LNLKAVYNVDELKNWRDEYGIRDFIASLRNKIRLDDDLRGIQILSPQAERDLLDLAESEISDLNFTQYTRLMEEQITSLDLGSFIQRLRQVKQRLGRSPEGRIVGPAIGNQILFLEQMNQVLTIHNIQNQIPLCNSVFSRERSSTGSNDCFVLVLVLVVVVVVVVVGIFIL